MATFKKKELTELVGGDINSSGGDRNVSHDSEIETGPVDKPYNDASDFEKGRSTTTDKVFGRYRQNIPWFAVYSYGGRRSGVGSNLGESDSIVITKNTVEEKIEDLVKKSRDNDLTDKNNNPKLNKIIDILKDCDFNEKQLEDLKGLIQDKEDNPKKNKNL